MPELTNPFAGVLLPERKLTKRELVRGLRLSVIAEQDATALYEALADAVDDENIKKLLQSVANEEKVHIGEFQKVIEELDAGEEGFLAEGEDEAEELMSSAKLAGREFGAQMLANTLAKVQKGSSLQLFEVEQLLGVLRSIFAPLIFLAGEAKFILGYTIMKSILENMKKEQQTAQEGQGNEYLWTYPISEEHNMQSTGY